VQFHEDVFPYKDYKVISDTTKGPQKPSQNIIRLPLPIDDQRQIVRSLNSRETYESQGVSVNTQSSENTRENTEESASPIEISNGTSNHQSTINQVPVISTSTMPQHITTTIPQTIVNEFNTHTHIRRGGRVSKFPSKYDIFEVNIPKALVVETVKDLEDTPKNYKQAMTTPHWLQAMKEEYQALIDNKTWNLVSPEQHMNVIGTKWVFKIKRKPDGTVERYKARLVAQGFKQHENVDYGLIYSPVVKSSTIRIILSLVVNNCYILRQIDVKNAFLQGELKETVFIAQPPGTLSPGLHFSKNTDDHHRMIGFCQAAFDV